MPTTDMSHLKWMTLAIHNETMTLTIPGDMLDVMLCGNVLSIHIHTPLVAIAILRSVLYFWFLH